MILRSYSQLKTLSKKLKRAKKTIVWTNGCFDLFHYGHLKSLEYAKGFGDVLIVGLNGDRSPYFKQKLFRPLQPEKARAALIDSLKLVDYVFIFQEETPLKALEVLLPHVLLKGADYDVKNIIGADIVRSHGGRIVRIPLVHGFSTTALVQKILNSYSSPQ